MKSEKAVVFERADDIEFVSAVGTVWGGNRVLNFFKK